MLRAITFDYWGTLVDAGHSLRAERVDALGRYLGDCVPEQISEACDEAWRQFCQAIDSGLGLGTATFLSTTLDLLGVTLSPPDRTAILHLWEEAMLDDPPALLNEAPHVLRALRARGLWVGLISDTGVTPGRIIRRMLHRAGILTMFDWLTFSNEIGVTKRRPQAFTSTLRALGVCPDEALHVGDLPQTDLKGARAVGMYTALLLENSGHREGIPLADIVLDRLRDLPEALERWDGGQ